MKYLFTLLLLASTASAQELTNVEVAKIEKRNVDLLSALTVRGQDSILLAEALQNAAKVYNDAAQKAQKEVPKEETKKEE